MSEAALKASELFVLGPVGALSKKCLTRSNDETPSGLKLSLARGIFLGVK